MVRRLVAVDVATARVVRVQRRSTQRSAAARNTKDAHTKTAIARAVAWLVSGTSKFLFPASIAGISSGRLAIHDIGCSRGGVVDQRRLIVFPSWKGRRAVQPRKALERLEYIAVPGVTAVS